VPEIPPLPPSTILLVEVGSTAHGTGLPGGEDHDEMGVVVEPAPSVLGLAESGMRSVMQRTQPEGSRSGPGDTDRTLHSLRRFARLAAGGNPSILMCLWAPVLHTTPDGDALRALAPAFVGRHVVPRYRGYMQAQALRLLGLRGRGSHGRRGSGARPELIAAHGFDTKFAMHAARLGFQGSSW
jgi:predicted nucleotidyltransferase